MIKVPEIARYAVTLGNPSELIPVPYGPVVLFTDHDLVLDQLLEKINEMQIEIDYLKEHKK